MGCSSLRCLHRHHPNALASASARSRDVGGTEWPSTEVSDFEPSLSFVTPQGMVLLGDGVEVGVDVLRNVNRENYRKMTRNLAAIMFATAELATCSVTGQRWSRAEVGGDRPVKPALEPAKIDAIIMCVKSRFPLVSASKIKQVLAYKCKEASNSHRAKLMKYFRSDGVE